MQRGWSAAVSIRQERASFFSRSAVRYWWYFSKFKFGLCLKISVDAPRANLVNVSFRVSLLVLFSIIKIPSWDSARNPCDINASSSVCVFIVPHRVAITCESDS